MFRKGITIMKKEKNFVSSLSYSNKKIKEILLKKIADENNLVKENINKDDLTKEKKILQDLTYKANKINTVSLFSGAGGLDLGCELASVVISNGEKKTYEFFKDKLKYNELRKKSMVNFIYSNDILESANQTYIKNFSSTVTKVKKDIRKINTFPKSDLILGGFPCPGFSSAGPRLLDDPRNFLYIHYIRALLQSQPLFFVAENVKGLVTMANGQVLNQIKEDFEAANYSVSTYLVNSRDYGVPQNRERVFLIGVRKDIETEFNFSYSPPIKTHGPMKNQQPYITLKDVLHDLPLHPNDVFDASYSSMYMSRNRKKEWHEQSFTIQASGRQAPQHPAGESMKKIDKDNWIFQGEFNRRLSVKECARIQTFPDWFYFSDGNKKTVSKNHLLNEQYKQIGNAVPVLLAEKMIRPIIEFLHQHPELLINKKYN